MVPFQVAPCLPFCVEEVANGAQEIKRELNLRRKAQGISSNLEVRKEQHKMSGMMGYVSIVVSPDFISKSFLNTWQRRLGV